MLTADQKHRLRKSFSFVERHSHVAALVFYRRLFELAPEVRPLFKNDIEVQAGKLMDMLAAALSLLEKPTELTATLEELGARHVGYGVTADHYPIVGQALLDMFGEVLGETFTDDLRDGWATLYNVIAATMLRGAARVAR